MIRPVRFASNAETASSNAFQQNGMDAGVAQLLAQREFDAYVQALRAAGVNVIVVEDTPHPHTPDSLFPNNWVSFHADGSVLLYPMEAPNRRMERRVAVLAEIEKQFAIRDIVDLGHFERQGRFLEGTGSMVLDHEQKLAYACHSSRTQPEAMEAFERRTGYKALWFHARDRRGKAIYHTNVMMCIGKTLAVVCLESIANAEEREAVGASLRNSGREVIDISHAQMEAFAGNMLELQSRHGHPVFVMSCRARNALHPEQWKRISSYAEPVLAPIETIEQLGGGSARCMIAEIFLPPVAAQNEPVAEAVHAVTAKR
jgi:hypothetical protein